MLRPVRPEHDLPFDQKSPQKELKMDTKIKQAEILKYLSLGLSYAFSYAYIWFFTMYTNNRIAITVFLTCLSLGAIFWLEISIRRQYLLEHFTPSRFQRAETIFWEAILVLLSVSTLSGGNKPFLHPPRGHLHGALRNRTPSVRTFFLPDRGRSRKRMFPPSLRKLFPADPHHRRILPKFA